MAKNGGFFICSCAHLFILFVCEHLFTFQFCALMPKISKENFAKGLGRGSTKTLQLASKYHFFFQNEIQNINTFNVKE